MTSILRRLLLVMALLLQGQAAAWAAVPMALPTAPLSTASADAALPCHGAEGDEHRIAAPETAMPCCEAGDCVCGVDCMVQASTPLPVMPELGAYLRMHFESLGRLETPRPAHPHALLRPPAPVHG